MENNKFGQKETTKSILGKTIVAVVVTGVLTFFVLVVVNQFTPIM